MFHRVYKDLLDLRDPTVNPVMLETVDLKELRECVERRAREVTRETKDVSSKYRVTSWKDFTIQN